MGWLDSLGGFLGNVGSGIGQFFTGGNYGQGQAFGTGGNSGFNLPNAIGKLGQFGMNTGKNALGSMFPSQGWGSSNLGKGSQINGQNADQSGGFNFGKMAPGIFSMFGANMIPNPKIPQLPSSFQQFQNQANAGGTPGMQAANQYYQGVLSGSNQAPYNAAVQSIDLNYQERLRQLNGMYKSLRPGADPTTDSTWARDLDNLNKEYQQQRAMALAQVQQGAAQGAAGLGAEQANQQQAAIETQVNQLATQWQMDYQQKAALRQMLMQLSGYGALGSMFPGMFNR